MPTPLLKLPLLLAVTGGVKMGFTPPRAMPSSTERKNYDGDQCTKEAVPSVGTWGPIIFKALGYASQLWEAYLILLQNAPPSLWHTSVVSFLRHASIGALPAARRLHIAPVYLVGALFIVAGAYWRVVCFRRLGRFFTFELSVQKDHELVTDGPYAVVRHPSYGAALMQVIGLVLCMTSAGSWWAESGMWHTRVGRIVSLVVGTHVTVCIVGGVDRTFKEDEKMKQMFKEEWAEWAKKTRYRLIPYIF